MASAGAINAPAKLNLTLHVGGRRRDGYHDLRSLVCGVTLTDRVSASATVKGVVRVLCDDPRIAEEENLAYRALQCLRTQQKTEQGIRLQIQKRIPSGAGMGGGSSDAAAALLLARELWGLSLTDNELAALGARVGSDVPLFFSLPSAIMTGRGEHVSPLTMRWRGWFVLVHAGVGVSTPEVYRRLDSFPARFSSEDLTERAVEARSASELSSCLQNDLTEAVFAVAPRIQLLREQLQAMGGPMFHLTGAGSTFFTPVDSEGEAGELAGRIGDAKLKVRVEVVRFLPSALVVERQP